MHTMRWVPLLLSPSRTSFRAVSFYRVPNAADGSTFSASDTQAGKGTAISRRIQNRNDKSLQKRSPRALQTLYGMLLGVKYPLDSFNITWGGETEPFAGHEQTAGKPSGFLRMDTQSLGSEGAHADSGDWPEPLARIPPRVHLQEEKPRLKVWLSLHTPSAGRKTTNGI